MLVLRAAPGEVRAKDKLEARLLEVAKGAWSSAALVVGAGANATAAKPPEGSAASTLTPEPAADALTIAAGKLAVYAAKTPSIWKVTLGTAREQIGAPMTTAKTGPQAPLRPPTKEAVPAWKRWYTWVIGGALVVGIGAVIIADRVGDDQVTVHVKR